MSTCRLCRCLLALFFLGSALTKTLSADEDLASRLPPDTLFYAELPNPVASLEEGARSAWGKILAEAEVKAFVDSIRVPASSDREVALLASLSTVLGDLDVARLEVAVTHLEGEPNASDSPWNFLVAVEVGSSDARQTLLERVENVFRLGVRDADSFRGYQIEIRGKPVRTFEDGVRRFYCYEAPPRRMLFSFSRSSLERLWTREQEASLATSDAFRRAKASWSDSDELRAFLNTRALRSELARSDSFDRALNWVLPDSLATGLRFQGDAVRTRIRLDLESRGFFLSSAISRQAVKLEPFAHVPSDALMAGTTILDMKTLWPLMAEFGRVLELYDLAAEASALRESTGIDLQRDVLGRLNGELLYYTTPPKGPFPLLGIVAALGVHDVEALEKSLATSIDRLDASEHHTVTYRGHTLYVLGSDAADAVPLRPACTFLEGRLWMARDVLTLKEHLARRGADEFESLLESAAFQSAWKRADLPDPVQAVHFTDTATAVGLAYGPIHEALHARAAGAEAIPFDMPPPPSVEVITQHLFPSLSFVRWVSDGLEVDSVGPAGDEVLIHGIQFSIGLFSATTALAPKTAPARREQAVSTILHLEIAIKMYSLDNVGRRPDALEQLIEPTEVSETGYLEQSGIPLDPWGNPYLYRVSSHPTADDYDIISYGEDGVEGGTGAAEDITLSALREQRQSRRRR